MLHFFIKHKLIVLGIVVGALIGYAYYFFVGCNSGTCAITSQPVNSTIFGAFMGGLLFDTFQKKKQ